MYTKNNNKDDVRFLCWLSVALQVRSVENIVELFMRAKTGCCFSVYPFRVAIVSNGIRNSGLLGIVSRV